MKEGVGLMSEELIAVMGGYVDRGVRVTFMRAQSSLNYSYTTICI